MVIIVEGNAVCLNLNCISFPDNIGNATVLKDNQDSEPMKVSFQNEGNDIKLSFDNKKFQLSTVPGPVVIKPNISVTRAVLNYLNNKLYDEYKSIYFEPLVQKMSTILRTN